MAHAVDWQRLGAAVAFYGARGWRYVEASWWVSREASSITCPDPFRAMAISGHGDLVGSAEQSFLQMELNGSLGRGRFMACTPCFRNEPTIDRLHQLAFMKVELYDNLDVGEAGLERAIADARSFMSSACPASSLLTREPTAEGSDLVLNGIEVGSYGIRRASGMAWVYGTGLAEPRFSQASSERAS